jgi:hypothetical protein
MPNSNNHYDMNRSDLPFDINICSIIHDSLKTNDIVDGISGTLILKSIYNDIVFSIPSDKVVNISGNLEVKSDLNVKGQIKSDGLKVALAQQIEASFNNLNFDNSYANLISFNDLSNIVYDLCSNIITIYGNIDNIDLSLNLLNTNIINLDSSVNILDDSVNDIQNNYVLKNSDTCLNNLEINERLIINNEIITFDVTVDTKTENHSRYNEGSNLSYRINNDELNNINLELGKTYRFLQEDSDNSSHRLKFYEDEERNNEITNNVFFSNEEPGNNGSYSQITITNVDNSIYFQCQNHNYMGGSINITNLTNIINNNYTFENINSNNANIDNLDAINVNIAGNLLLNNNDISNTFSNIDNSLVDIYDILNNSTFSSNTVINGQDASFNNIDISGSLNSNNIILNNINVNTKFATIDTSFSDVNNKLDTIDSSFTNVNTKFDTIDSSFSDVNNKLDTIDSSFNKIDISLISIQDSLNNNNIINAQDASFNNIDISGTLKIDGSNIIPIPSQTSNSGKYLTTNGSNLSWGTVSTGGGGISNYATFTYQRYTGQIISTAFTRLEYDTINTSGGSDITLDTTTNIGRITLASTGVYMINYYSTSWIYTGATRIITECMLYVNPNTGSFSQEIGTRSFCYLRQANDPENTSGISYLLTVSASNTEIEIRFRADLNLTAKMKTECCGITIVKIA